MNREILLKFKNHFIQERQRLLCNGTPLVDQFNLSQDEMFDEVDLTTSELERSMRIRLKNREALFLKKIDSALTRIQEGTFGLCEDCEEPIEIARLEARPTSTFCVPCKEGRERMEASHIDGLKPKSVGRQLRLA